MKSTELRPYRRWGLRLLGALVSERRNYGLFGDIEELYERQVAAVGRFRASLWLWGQVVRTLFHSVFNSLYWSGVLLKNSLKITYRNFKRQKLGTVINLAGLAVGMACFILIMTYVHHETGFDSFHENAGRIYRLTMAGTLSGQDFNLATSNGAIAPDLMTELPEIESVVRIRRRYRTTVEYGDKLFFEQGILWADAPAFEVFSYRLLKGNSGTALAAPFSAVLTRETAERYFGHEDPVGKVLRINRAQDYTVTGVVEDPPGDSHLDFDMLLSFVTYQNANRLDFTRWLGDFNNYSYLLLRQGTDPDALENKFLSLIERKMGPVLKKVGGEIRFALQPVTDIHLHSRLNGEISRNSDVATVSIYAAVALFILFLACINFMNLAAARSAKRALEVGIRKVHGAVKSKLISQFLGEALIQSFLALFLGILLVQAGLTLFRSVIRVDLPHPFTEIPWLVPGLIGLALLVGLGAGSYPAFVLSRFKPAEVLRGGMSRGRSRSRFRSVLVVFQFAVSTFLLIITGVILGQVRFMRTKDLGYDRQRVVVVRLDTPESRTSIEAIKQEFRRLPGVVSVGASSHAPDWGAHHNICQPEGFELDESPGMGIISVDRDYLDAMGIDVLRGRGFSEDFPGDAGKSVLINETAARRFGWDDPVGKKIRELDGQGIYKTVVGVVRDFHFRDVRQLIEPMMIDFGPEDAEALVVRLAPGDLSGRVEGLNRVWKGVAGGAPFDAYFLENALEAEYGPEENLAALFTSFSLLAVFIACLGLFGMAAFTAEQRTKEIGIRKVLGASAAKLVAILNRDMGKFILLANVIAWPLGYLAARWWLRDFAYRTSVPLWVFVAAAGLVFGIGFLTTSYHSLRAASSDPVDSIRYE
ncbi:MAG: ABC transporter permease [Candidatus Aminicenantes bacterium]|nr:ABC transporter permease [Candidatus Aminicenantes bacterium]